MASLDDCQDFLFRSKSEFAAQDVSKWLALPCANIDKMVPVEMLMYEPDYAFPMRMISMLSSTCL